MSGTDFRSFCAVALVVVLGFAGDPAHAAETDPDGRVFEPADNPLADVQQALERAADADKRALVVLGANWCHDSRALAARLHRSPLAEVIDEHYELQFVDVGFYEDLRALTTQFGVAQYYATPTVLIIDPSNGRLLNDEDRHRWGNAFRISMPESVQYFEKWASADVDATPAAPVAEIDAFEAQLAQRVADGYAVVGPLLRDYAQGNEPLEFKARWDELSAFRNAIPGAIRELREQAARGVADGEQDVELQFPEFPPLSWEAAD